MPAPPVPSELPATHASPSLAASEALPAGSTLSEFKILRVLGSGGFGIVYLAHDESLGRLVALKEYLPVSLAGRGIDGQVQVRSSSFADTFAAGLSSFVNEAQLLARFDHPSLVKVHRFWQANATAYMVMPYYEGVTLRQVRESMSVPPDEAWLRRLLDSLLGALEVMHDASVFHRDVAPDNILMLPSGVPVLLDFGAARHALAGQTQVLTAILKPSYAPIEQYAGVSEFRQGPWTDIYATAATLHYCLTGKAPSTSAARTVHDTQRPLHQREEFCATTSDRPYDEKWLEALDWGLTVMPQGRPQSIAEWREALAGRLPVPSATSSTGPIIAAPVRTTSGEHFPATQLHARTQFPATVASTATQFEATRLDARDSPGVDPRQGAVSTSAAQAAHVPVSGPDEAGVDGPAPTPETTSPHAAAPRSRVVPWPWAIAGFAAVVFSGGLWSLLATHPAPTSAAAPLSTATAAAARSGGADPGPRPARPGAAPTGIAREPAPVPVKKDRAAVAGAGPDGSRTPAAVKPPAPSSPRQICGDPDRAWLSRLNCMRITCTTPKWERHPQCANWQLLAQPGNS